MLYLKCPTCKTTLGSIQIQYENISNRITLDIENGKITQSEGDKLRQELINSLELNRYCCKMRVMTYMKAIDIVK